MKVFLDVDGVLANFRQGVCNAFDRPNTIELKKIWTFWDLWPDITFKMVNDICTHDFWANLPFTKEGHGIFDAVIQRFDREQVYFLTTPMPNVESYSGKLEWLCKYFPGFEKRTIITMTPKSVFAGSDTLLIDDNSDNIVNFFAAGGNVILVPRMWNSLNKYCDQALKYVERRLEDLA